jgi:hypothetical protein
VPCFTVGADDGVLAGAVEAPVGVEPADEVAEPDAAEVEVEV